MRYWYVLTAIGSDRPGIVADLAESIYECDCNLEDSSMTLLGNEFAVLLLLSSPTAESQTRLSAACKRVEWERHITVFFRRLESEPVFAGGDRPTAQYELHATGTDKAGIVARVARCLANHGVNIAHLISRAHPEPGTGTAIYTMRIGLDVPPGLSISSLRDALESVADEVNIHIDLTPAG